MGDDNRSAENLIERWHGVSGGEIAIHQIFIGELCTLRDVPTLQPASAEAADDIYVCKRRFDFMHGSGEHSAGRAVTRSEEAFATDFQALLAAMEPQIGG